MVSIVHQINTLSLQYPQCKFKFVWFDARQLLKHSYTSYKRCFLSDRKRYEYMKMMLFMLWFFEEESQVHAENVEAKQQLL